VIRGTLLGPIKGVGDVFGTPYDVTWLVALIAAIVTFLWGRIVINGALQRMNAAPKVTIIRPRGSETRWRSLAAASRNVAECLGLSALQIAIARYIAAVTLLTLPTSVLPP
jgi:hypothetical protein